MLMKKNNDKLLTKSACNNLARKQKPLKKIVSKRIKDELQSLSDISLKTIRPKSGFLIKESMLKQSDVIQDLKWQLKKSKTNLEKFDLYHWVLEVSSRSQNEFN